MNKVMLHKSCQAGGNKKRSGSTSSNLSRASQRSIRKIYGEN